MRTSIANRSPGKANIQLNRKVLSELAVFEPYSFMAVANHAKQFATTLKPKAPQATIASR